MLNSLLTSVFGSRNERLLKQLSGIVKKINALEPQMQALSDEALKAKTDEFRARVAKGESLDKLLPEAFAVCREASVRVFGMRHVYSQVRETPDLLSAYHHFSGGRAALARPTRPPAPPRSRALDAASPRIAPARQMLPPALTWQDAELLAAGGAFASLYAAQFAGAVDPDDETVDVGAPA